MQAGHAASADTVLTRAVRVLEALSGMEQPASLEEVAVRAELPRTRTYRALRALERDGYVDHLGRTGYRVGGRSLSLALLLGPRPILRQRALPVVSRLSASTSTTATLFLRSGADRVLMLGVEPSWAEARLGIVVGERAPLVSGCAGRAILAYLDPEDQDGMSTDGPLGDRDVAPEDLAAIRRLGYAISRNENHDGVIGLAAPLLDPDGDTVLGSLCVAGGTNRIREGDLPGLATSLLAAAADLGPQLAPVIGRHGGVRHAALDVGLAHRDDA